MGIFKSIFGFVSNDYFYIEADRLSKENEKIPLVKGTISKNFLLFSFFLSIILKFYLFWTYLSNNLYKGLRRNNLESDKT